MMFLQPAARRVRALRRSPHGTTRKWLSCPHANRCISTAVACDAHNDSDEQTIRRDLAAAHMLSHAHGFDELVWNHISARLDANGSFLISPGDQHFDEVTPQSLIVSSPANTNITADVIHSAIYKARPDGGAVVHHHTTAVVAVSALQGGLKFVTQDSAAFFGKVVYHDWEGVSDDYDECSRIAERVADSGAHTVIMRNHGALTFGTTVAQAWVRYYYLDRVCRVQCATQGQPVVQPDAAVLEHAMRQYEGGGEFSHGKLEWPALLRQAERARARGGW